MFGFSFYYAKAKTAVVSCVMNLSRVHPACSSCWSQGEETLGRSCPQGPGTEMLPVAELGTDWGSRERHQATPAGHCRPHAAGVRAESSGKGSQGVECGLCWKGGRDSSRICFPGMNSSFSPAGDATCWLSPLVVTSPTPLVPNGPDSPGQPLPSEAAERAPARDSTTFTGIRKKRLSLRKMLIKYS